VPSGLFAYTLAIFLAAVAVALDHRARMTVAPMLQ